MALSEEATSSCTLAPPVSMVASIPFTTSPVPAELTGICSFSTNVTPSTTTVVLGATTVGDEIRTVDPTINSPIDVVPVVPVQVADDDDLTRSARNIGRPEVACQTAAADAEAVDWMGSRAVATLAQSWVALTAPISSVSHGVVVLAVEAVLTVPVSGAGTMLNVPNRGTDPLADRAKALPLRTSGH